MKQWQIKREKQGKAQVSLWGGGGGLSERKGLHWRETHVVLTWGPQRLGPRREAGLLERRKIGGVVYLDMLFSVFNARITIKMLRLISYVYKTV